MSGDRKDSSLLVSMIEANNWLMVEKHISQDQDTVKDTYWPHASLLHWLCSVGSTPLSLIETVASIDPSVITESDERHGDTCLHIIARNCQKSAKKMECLLNQLQAVGRPSILTRNRFGGTVLHSAANHNAVLETLQLIVAYDPEIIRVTTFDGSHAVSALWNSFIQTIPGYMLVARILDSSEDVSGEAFFQRFWEKASFLTHKYADFLGLVAPCSGASNSRAVAKSTDFVVHGLLKSNVTINFVKVALKINRAYALAVDSGGNYPLHRLLQDRPYRLKEREAIALFVESAAEAVASLNRMNESPLLIAIRNRIPWENGLDIVAQNGNHALALIDEMGLFPFQYAAFVGGRFAVETCFQLLIMRPDLLKQ